MLHRHVYCLLYALALSHFKEVATSDLNAPQDKVQNFWSWVRLHFAQIKYELEIEKYQNKSVEDDPIIEFLDETEDDVNGNENKHNAVKREILYGPDIVKTKLSRPNSPYDIFLIESREEKEERRQGRSRRIKRGVYNTTERTWPHKIPLVLDSSYDGDVARLKRVLKFISDHVCVYFHDVTDTYDPSDAKWFTRHGFDVNSYILVKSGDGCAATMGRGSGDGPRGVTPCYGFWIMLHEMLHTIGGIHMQAVAERDSYITVHKDYIDPSLLGTYNKEATSDVVSEFFDPNSALMYGDKTWSAGGLPTYTPLRDDLFQPYISSESVIFLELNEVYQCKELFCHYDRRTCGPGYLTLIGGSCRCVCPDDLDPARDCLEQINGPNRDLRWPHTPMVISAVYNHCPREFIPDVNQLPLTGYAPPEQEPVPDYIPSRGNTLEVPLCSKTTPWDYSMIDWTSWPPGGHYCIIKPIIEYCDGGFKEGEVVFKTSRLSRPKGDIGDIDVKGQEVTVRFCCRDEEHWAMVVDLPNADPFRLFAIGQCPNIRGLKVTKSRITLYMKEAKAPGKKPPQVDISDNDMDLFQCVYLPPKYGCNQRIYLHRWRRSVRLITPGFGMFREPNRRCLYGFKVPENSRLRVTFWTFDLHPEDEFWVKQDHQWQDPLLIKNGTSLHQIVSTKEYLSLEYWSSWETAYNQGVDFSVDVILEEDFCYDPVTNGEDYNGDKSVTETYEECLPWAMATACDDFPANGLNVFTLLSSGNKCRNPDGALFQPWCYTYINGTVCNKRYCDVCNFNSPKDVLTDCPARMAADPSFCLDSVERFGCFKSCKLPLQEYKPETFGPPTIPTDGQVDLGSVLPKNKEGTYVNVSCPHFSFSNVSSQMRLGREGWTTLAQACNACPPGWVPYGDRCFRYFSSYLTRREAEKDCRTSYGPSGTLFQILDADDQMVVKVFKTLNNADYGDRNWISGELRPVGRKWLFTDTDTEMTYFNLSDSDKKIQKETPQCIKIASMLPKYDQEGLWKLSECDGGEKCQYMCQIDALDVPCVDQLDFCERILSVFPNFCTAAHSVDAAELYCRKSCGECSGSTRCSEPISETYHRTSLLSLTEPGDVMTFECNPDLLHAGGSLSRACSPSGQLLGEEPVCQANVPILEIMLSSVVPRDNVLPLNVAILMTMSGYSIPCNGKITRWYYYCHNPGPVYLLVYRPNKKSYDYVGHNYVSCDAEWKMQMDVPSAAQISVRKDDVVGVYSSTPSALSISDCQSGKTPGFKLPSMTAPSISKLTESKQPFKDTYCAVPSLGFRVAQ